MIKEKDTYDNNEIGKSFFSKGCDSGAHVVKGFPLESPFLKKLLELKREVI